MGLPHEYGNHLGAIGATGQPLSPWIWADCVPSLRDSPAAQRADEFVLLTVGKT